MMASSLLSSPLLADNETTFAQNSEDDYGSMTLTWHNINAFVRDSSKSTSTTKASHDRGTANAQDDGVIEGTGKTSRAIPAKKTARPRLKRVLTGVSGHVGPGELLAIMGPSGSGKTTLLNLLGGREQLGEGGKWSGRLRINGRPLQRGWQRSLGFVMQKDIFFDDLTVEQELEFAAALRLPKKLTWAQKKERARSVAQALGLSGVLSTPIGGAVERGLSGGELKRLNIAVELLADPALLLLDEPLTGLDSTKAATVMQLLRDRCNRASDTVTGSNGGDGAAAAAFAAAAAVNGWSRATSVALSIHQPSSKLFALFDRLVILAPEGRVVYFGDAPGAAAAFEAVGRPIPSLWNPTDHYIECVGDEDTVAKLRAVTWSSSEEEGDRGAGDDGDDDDGDDDDEGDDGAAPLLKQWSSWLSASSSGSSASLRPPIGAQVWHLARRGMLTSKGSALKPMEFVLCIGLASIFGVLWFGIARGSGFCRAEVADDVLSILFFCVAQWTWGPAMQQVAAFPRDRDVLVKELAAEAYTVEAYFLARGICELPVSTVLPLAFYVVLWPLVGLPALAMPVAYGASLLISWTSSSLAVLVSAAVFDESRVLVVMILVLMFFMCAGGFFLDLTQQPLFISWVRFSSFWYYAIGLMLRIVEPYDSTGSLEDAAEDGYSFSTWSGPANAAMVVGHGAIFRIAAYICLKTSRKLKFS